LNLSTPDGISKVNSAIINLQVYMTPTVTFTLWVNGLPCNTPSYTVSTTYASSGQGLITFDCSNRINQQGLYTITLRTTSANTGASTSWIDLSYINNQDDYVSSVGNVNKVDIVGKVDEARMEVSGTEYNIGDEATIFLQLLDSNQNPITNGSCYLDVWYPLNSSNEHPYQIQDAPMLKALGDDGIYYYDIIAPDIEGVYMLSAKCNYAFNWIWVYPEDEAIYFPIAQRVTGTWVGNTLALNSKADDIYERCSATASVLCQSNYTYNLSAYGIPINNITVINMYYAGQGDVVGKVVTFAYLNGTTFVNLPNTLTISDTGATATTSGDIDLFVTNSIPSSAISEGIIKIRMTTPTGLARYYNNWMSLVLLNYQGTIFDIKGSSEMHITNLSLRTARNVWDFETRNLTYYSTQNLTGIVNSTQIAESVWQYEGSIADNILTAIATKIWEFLGGVAEIIT